MTLQEAKDYINKTLPDRLKASDPMYKAGIVRAVLFVVLDAAQGLIDALKSSISAKLNVVDFNDGLRFNYNLTISPENNKPAVRHFKVATLLAEDNLGLLDTLRIVAVLGGWGASQRGVIDMTIANRAGLTPYTIINGNPQGAGFAVYRQADKTAILYLRLPNSFSMASLSVLQNYQTTLLPSFTEEVPTGTLVYDSTDKTSYPPALQLDTTSAVRGFLRTGAANIGFQLTGLRSASNQTLNTGGYVELKLEDGNIIKVAVLN